MGAFNILNMGKKIQEQYYYIAGFLVTVIVVISFSFVFHSYKNPKDDLLYCQRNKPAYNNTDNERANKCFNEIWPEYCKIRSPKDCPILLNYSSHFLTAPSG